MPALLEVEGLTKSFRGRGSLGWGRPTEIRAVDGINLSVETGESLAIVGESGSGKTTVARCITRLIEPTAGTILFAGRDITTLRGRGLRSLRNQISLVFQDPFSSLDPRQKIGSIIAEPLRVHGVGNRASVRSRVQELLELVGLSPEHANRYPHQFSGGQRQRVGIARALAVKTKLIVCDEPVSALDVSVQAQILNLLKDLQRDLGLTYVFISHDLSVVHYVADRVVVMYRGRIVEQAARDELFAKPHHPYTAELLAAVPVPDPDLRPPEVTGASSIETPGSLTGDTGCAFAPRCPFARPRPCLDEAPALLPLEERREAACYFPLGAGESRA
jgi:oligopeptide transport system ATP-binding protein